MDRKLYDWGGNILAFVLVLSVNILANIIPIGGQTTGDISSKYPSLFTPAGYTFSIWSLIYLCLFCFVIFQALPSQRQNNEIASIQKIFVLNCLANSAWIFAWHFELILLSLIIMVVIFLTLIRIYRLVCIYNSDSKSTLSHHIFIKLPFSLYTGWITVAILANISVVQSGYGWENSGLSAINWTLFKLALAGAIGSLILLIRKDFIYALVIAWAAFGISIKQMPEPAVFGSAFTIGILMIILVAFAIFNKSFKFNYTIPPNLKR